MDLTEVIETLVQELRIKSIGDGDSQVRCSLPNTININQNNNIITSESLLHQHGNNNGTKLNGITSANIICDLATKSNIQISFKKENRFSLSVCWEIISHTDDELVFKPSWLRTKPEKKWVVVSIKTMDSNTLEYHITETRQSKGVQKVENLDPDEHYIAVVCCLKHSTDNCPACNKWFAGGKKLSKCTGDINDNLYSSVFPHNLEINVQCQKFQTVLSMQEMEILCKKAKEYVMDQKKEMQLVSQLYRNKSPEYFCNILENEPGSRIMVPYIKDDNGDPGCPINGRINGLFFSGIKHKNLDSPSPISPFGTHRFLLPADRLINTANRLYFSDFYCYGMDVHYINVVVTQPDSDADRFCSTRLPKLDLSNNPFLMLNGKSADEQEQSAGHTLVEITPVVHVEIFYTEAVDVQDALDHGGKIYCTDTIGRGYALPEGVPKNSLCPKCNI